MNYIKIFHHCAFRRRWVFIFSPALWYNYFMINYHSLSINECLRELKTSVNGLTDEEAQRRIKKYGLNKIAEKKKTGILTMLANQFKSPMVYILLVGGIIALILQKYIDLSVILGVVIINCLIGFGQEYKASVELDKLKSMIKQKVMIIRDQREKIIDASLLTIGDIMLLQTGNRIAADARLVNVNNLEIDEASLTGESLPVVKTEAKLLAGVSLGDRKNLVFAGTVVIKGQGKAVVTSLGEKTEFGQIAKMVSDNHEEKTPLQLKLDKFSKNLALAALFISFFIIIIGLWQGHALFEMLMMSVALVAAIIPEGLTIAITVILVLGMRQLLRQNVLTRKLSAAEVLGSTTVIASDKTGTLTQGKMVVSHLVIGDQEFSLNNWEKKDKETVKVLNLILQAAVFCNDAVIENPDEELAGWIIRGTPTEIALLTAGIQAGLQPANLLKAEPKVTALPFDNANKFMITLNKRKSGGYILYEKGAAEVLINKSTTYYKFGRIIKLNQKEKLKLRLVTEKLSNKGLRVMALLHKSACGFVI